MHHVTPYVSSPAGSGDDTGSAPASEDMSASERRVRLTICVIHFLHHRTMSTLMKLISLVSHVFRKRVRRRNVLTFMIRLQMFLLLNRSILWKMVQLGLLRMSLPLFLNYA